MHRPQLCVSRAFTSHVDVADLDESHSDHVKELNSARPKQPFFFLKPPTSLLLPGQGNVIRPKGVDLHYEIELALIIGKKITDLDPADDKGALDAIDSTLSSWLPHSVLGRY